MISVEKLINDAQHSSLRRIMLNLLLQWKIPFNAPHRFTITVIEADALTIALPFVRRNKNHINGIHACALATLCEYLTGLSLARSIDAEKYRLIMQQLKVEYKYQAKKNVEARFQLPEQIVNSQIILPLQQTEAIILPLQVEVYDDDKKHICSGTVTWQIKRWDSVKTKV